MPFTLYVSDSDCLPITLLEKVDLSTISHALVTLDILLHSVCEATLKYHGGTLFSIKYGGQDINRSPLILHFFRVQFRAEVLTSKALDTFDP